MQMEFNIGLPAGRTAAAGRRASAIYLYDAERPSHDHWIFRRAAERAGNSRHHQRLPVVSIEVGAFYDKTQLLSITIPNSVTSIGAVAFAYCSSLTSVIIGTSVTSMDSQAFGFCPNLKAAYFRGNSPTLADSTEFYEAANLTIYYQVGTTGWGGGLFDGYLPVPYSIIINGGFDDKGAFDGWTVSGNGSAQITGPNVYSGPDAAVFSETQSIIGVSDGTYNYLSQTLPTQPGKSYSLSFAVNGISNGDCTVYWDGQPVVQQSFNPGWVKLQAVVTASSSNTVLQFYIPSKFRKAQTIAIDSVSVLPLPQIAAQRISAVRYNCPPSWARSARITRSTAPPVSPHRSTGCNSPRLQVTHSETSPSPIRPARPRIISGAFARCRKTI